MDQPRVGFIGLGRMGARMAERLRAAGHLRAVWNRTDARADAFAEKGVRVAASPEDLARDCDVVFLSLYDGASVRDVLDGAEGRGFLRGARDGTVIVDTTTVAPSEARLFAERCARRGVSYLDCPVAGSLEPAESGALKALVGGDEDALERVRPMLDAIAGDVLHLGGSGAGATAKALVNAQLAVNLTALAEMLRVAETVGFAPHKALEVLATTGVNPQAATRGRDILAGGGDRMRFPAAYLLKDLSIFLSIADDADTPLASVAREAFEATVSRAGANADYTAVGAAYAGARTVSSGELRST